MDALRKIVANALGVKAVSDAEVAKMVAIEEVSFPEGKQDAKSLIDQVAQHSDLVRDAGAILVALVVIGGFVRMLRKTKPDDVIMEQMEPAGLVGREADTEAEPLEPEVITVEKINEMIKRRPSGVAAAIKSWISRSEGTNS
jgi:flagellar biosynthesis/type III secretory pathway M-ring protein FliF/YscJ